MRAARCSVVWMVLHLAVTGERKGMTIIVCGAVKYGTRLTGIYSVCCFLEKIIDWNLHAFEQVVCEEIKDDKRHTWTANWLPKLDKNVAVVV